MKLLYDSQAFDMQRYGGVSRYFSSLFEYFSITNDIAYDIPIGKTNNEYLQSLPPFNDPSYRRTGFGTGKEFKGRKAILQLMDRLDPQSSRNKAIRALKQGNYDLFHPTYYNPYFLPYLGKRPFVLTVHDMIHELYPQYFKLDRFAAFKKKVIPLASRIITVSAHTKKDLVNIYQIPEDKIDVIHLANSLQPVASMPEGMPALPERYMLYVGSRSRYKNFQGFIKSVTPLLKADKTLHVIAAGGYSFQNSFSAQEQAWFESEGIAGQLQQLSINDQKLAYLYQHALCFVFPSLYEGFGIPVVEAFACGCPAVISNCSSLPEVGGDAVLYFSPDNEEEMRQQIARVVSDETVRLSLAAKGKERLLQFSWAKTARKTIECYNSIIE